MSYFLDRNVLSRGFVLFFFFWLNVFVVITMKEVCQRMRARAMDEC